MTYRLLLGDLDLSPDAQGSDGYSFDVIGFRRGTPDPTVSVLSSLLADGSLERKLRNENRTVTLLVIIEADDSDASARAEEVLHRQLSQMPATLCWTPPDGVGATTAFDVLWADSTPAEDDGWDLDELRNNRGWTITLRCAPFGRSTTVQTFDASAVLNPARTVVLDGSTTSGWSVAPSAASLATSTDSGRTAIKVSGPGWTAGSPNTSTAEVSVAVPGGASVVSLDYLRRSSNDSEVARFTTPSGLLGVKPALQQSQSDGYMRNYYRVPAGATMLTLTVYMRDAGTPATVFYVDEFATMAAVPALSAKTSLRTVDIKGAVRTPGSLTLSHASQALGDVLLLTCPDLERGFLPDTRRYASTTTATSDTAATSGSRSTLNTSGGNYIVTLPYAMYAPGAYIPVLRVLRNDGVNPTTYTVTGLAGGVEVDSVTQVAPPVASSAFRWVVLPQISLPPRLTGPNNKGTFQVRVGGEGEIDDCFLIPVGDGSTTGEEYALTLTSAPLTTRRLTIAAPSLDFPRGATWMGDAADGSDAISALTMLQSTGGQRLLAPPSLLVYSAVGGPTTPASITGEYYAASHTNSTA